MRARQRPRGASAVRVMAIATREEHALVFRVARKLDSPNAWRTHWTLGHRQMKDWQRAFETALVVQSGHTSRAGFLLAGGQPKAAPVRRRVTVIRQVPSARNFIRDEDDLRYTTKPLNDALKNAGLIFDDRAEFLEQATPRQEVSPDGLFWTIVRIEPDPTVEGRG